MRIGGMGRLSELTAAIVATTPVKFAWLKWEELGLRIQLWQVWNQAASARRRAQHSRRLGSLRWETQAGLPWPCRVCRKQGMRWLASPERLAEATCAAGLD
jgi:hypothetical protein